MMSSLLEQVIFKSNFLYKPTINDMKKFSLNHVS